MNRFVFAVDIEANLDLAKQHNRWALPVGSYVKNGGKIISGDHCVFYVTKEAVENAGDSCRASYFDLPATIISSPDAKSPSIYGDNYRGDFAIRPEEDYRFVYLETARSKLEFPSDWITKLQGRGLQQGNPIITDEGIRLFDRLWKTLRNEN